jgi:hypothetical protein
LAGRQLKRLVDAPQTISTAATATLRLWAEPDNGPISSLGRGANGPRGIRSRQQFMSRSMPLFAPSGWEKRISAVIRFGRRFQNPKRGSKRFRIRRPSQVMNRTNTTKQNALTRVHAGRSLRFKASGSALNWHRGRPRKDLPKDSARVVASAPHSAPRRLRCRFCRLPPPLPGPQSKAARQLATAKTPFCASGIP